MSSVSAYEWSSDEAVDHKNAHDSLPTVLLFVNIETSISKLTSELDKAVTVEHILNELLDECTCATPSDVVSGVTIDTKPQTQNIVERSIMRFKRDQDRWTALVSVLLKSLAFHRLNQGTPLDTTIEHFTSHAKSETLPIVILPRTKFNRPYIPVTLMQDTHETVHSDDDKRENEHPNSRISVSHQYPHIGIVQSSSYSKIGMDIVLFDFQKSEFTPTINDFLQSFESSFTKWEWEKIQYYCKGGLFRRNIVRDDKSKLREFFLRWAIKESYTKALGLGMHIEFSSFETRLMGIDEMEMNADTHKSIWSTISNAVDKREEDGTESKSANSYECIKRSVVSQYSVSGQVVHGDMNEIYEFIFVPISPDDVSSYEGCCCICRTPLSPCDKSVSNDFVVTKSPISIERMDLSDLIKFHKKH